MDIMLFVVLVLGTSISNGFYWESKKRNKQMQAQIDLLAQIAAAQGGINRKDSGDCCPVKSVTTFGCGDSKIFTAYIGKPFYCLILV